MNVLGRNCLWVFFTVARVKMSVIKKKGKKKKKKIPERKEKEKKYQKTHSLKDCFRIIVSHSFVH